MLIQWITTFWLRALYMSCSLNYFEIEIALAHARSADHKLDQSMNNYSTDLGDLGCKGLNVRLASDSS